MAVKASYSDEKEIPEALKKDYKKKGDIFILDIEGEPDGYVPESKFAEFRDNNKKLFNSLKKFEGIDPDKVKADLAELEELRKVGNDQKAVIETRVKAATERMAVELDTHKKRVAELEEERKSSIIDGALTRAANGKIQEKALDFVLHKGKSVFRIGSNGEPEAFKGDTAIKDAEGQPLTVDVWLSELIQENPFIALSSSGGGASGGIRSPGGSTNPFDKKNPNYTEQSKLVKSDPQRAQALAAQAGVELKL